MRIVFHIDMDAFFAAAEAREKPWLKGKPVVVGADPKNGKGRGVVSTASYKAREYGIHSAMPISQAWRLAEKAIGEGKPKTIFLAGDFEKYSAVSHRIMAILKKYASQFEQASIDEAYIEPKIFAYAPASPRLRRAGKAPAYAGVSAGRSADRQNSKVKIDLWVYPEQIAKKIKKEIFRKEKLTCSIGVGPNKLIAKIASNVQKPDGLTVITSEDIQKFLDPKPVGIIPGIGPKGGKFLQSKSVKSIADLRKVSRRQLVEWFGKWGEDMYEKARGIDDTSLAEDYAAKSIGEQETFEKDTLDSRILIKTLQKLARSVFTDTKERNFLFKTVSITVRFGDFETKTRAHTLKAPVCDYKAFEREALKLFLPFLDKRENFKKKPIRLIGIRAEHIVSPVQQEDASAVLQQGKLF